MKTLFAILFFCMCAGARAADWYVSLDGTGAGTSWADATNDLQGAVTAAASNDTVWVSNGTYAVTLTVGAGVTVRSKANDPATVILDGNYPTVTNIAVEMSSGAWLIGVTVSNGYAVAGGNWGGGISGGAASNSIITDNKSGDDGGGVAWCSLYNCTIKNNLAIVGDGGGGDGCTFYNCLITGNTATIGRGGGGYDSTFYNCTIVDNYASEGGGGGGGNSCTFINSISWDNSLPDQDCQDSFSCGINFTNTTSTTKDPFFVGGGDYRLIDRTSPCCNSGANGGWEGLSNSVDLAGSPRIFDGKVDMGCYEYSSPVVAILPGTSITSFLGTGTNAIRAIVK